MSIKNPGNYEQILQKLKLFSVTFHVDTQNFSGEQSLFTKRQSM